MTVVAADGQNVHPVTVDEFRIAVAETFDVIIEPGGQDAFTIFAQSMDRTGYARGTLAVREGLSAPVPDPDRRPLLTMADMGHGGVGHDMGATGTVASPTTKPAGDSHGGHSMPPQKPAAADPHASHNMPAQKPAAADPHAAHEPAQQPKTPDPHAGHNMTSMDMQSHPSSEQGNPLVDMQTMMPTARLDDPGIGLRENGRRVLTYADLRSVFDDPDGREPGRTIELHLTGHMDRFVWSFNGLKFSHAAPIELVYGERLRIVLVNDTMMAHPIHLHGMWSDLENDQGQFHVRKHTIDMPPGTRRAYRVRADALGRWAYHCHLLYHMEAGMFREVRVEE
jgi:CopA family copper-resistance protein